MRKFVKNYKKIFICLGIIAISAITIPTVVKAIEGWSDIMDAYTEILLTPGEDETMLNACWPSTEEGTPIIQIAKKTECTNSEIPENAKVYSGKQTEAYTDKSGESEVPYYSNKVTITNLEANTEYLYRYKTGESEYSQIFTYKTQDISKELKFIAVGDPQIGIGTGGTESDTQRWDETLREAFKVAPNASFITSMGDQVDSNQENQYAGLKCPTLLRSIPFAPIAGNHDCDVENLLWHFNRPNLTNYGTTAAGGDYYYSYGDNLLIISLNANAVIKSSKTANEITVEHRKCIEEAIASAPYAKWRIVTFHQDIYGYPYHYDDAEVTKVREQMYPLMDKYDIDVVLTGHGHNFTRSYQMYNNEPIGDTSIMANNEVNVNDPDGTVYFELSTSASKNYVNNIAGSNSHIANYYDEIDVRSFSVVSITDETLSIETYRTESGENSDTAQKYDTYKIEKTNRAKLDKVINQAKSIIDSESDNYTKEQISYLSNNYDIAIKAQKNYEINGSITDIYDAAVKLENAIEEIKPLSYGDVNDDGKVSLSDVIIIKKYLGKKVTLTDKQIKIADFDKSGEVTNDDILEIQKNIAGM